MIRVSKRVAAIWSVFFVVMLTACGGGAAVEKPESSNAEGESVENSEAEAIYKKMCITCHGNDLQGRAGPNLQKVGARLTEEQIIDVVSNGQKGMPSFNKRLTEEEIQSLAKWLSEHK